MLKKESTAMHFKIASRHKKIDKDSKKASNSKASNSKETWKKFLQDTKIKRQLEKSWEAPKPREEFKKIIKQLSKNFKSDKKI